MRSVTATNDGLVHSVYIVELAGRRVVLRANPRPEVLSGTERNLRALKGLGLPVPCVVAADLSRTNEPFAWLLLSYTPGRCSLVTSSAKPPAPNRPPGTHTWSAPPNGSPTVRSQSDAPLVALQQPGIYGTPSTWSETAEGITNINGAQRNQRHQPQETTS